MKLEDMDFLKSDYCGECGGKGFFAHKCRECNGKGKYDPDEDTGLVQRCFVCRGSGIEHGSHEQCETCEELHRQELIADRMQDEAKGN